MLGPWQTEVAGKLVKARLQLPPMCYDDIAKHTKNNMYNVSKTGDPWHSMAFHGIPWLGGFDSTLLLSLAK